MKYGEKKKKKNPTPQRCRSSYRLSDENTRIDNKRGKTNRKRKTREENRSLSPQIPKCSGTLKPSHDPSAPATDHGESRVTVLRLLRHDSLEGGRVLHLPLLLLLLQLLLQLLAVLVGPRGVVDEGELQQRAEHECEAHARPHVDGLRGRNGGWVGVAGGRGAGGGRGKCSMDYCEWWAVWSSKEKVSSNAKDSPFFSLNQITHKNKYDLEAVVRMIYCQILEWLAFYIFFKTKRKEQ